MASTTQNAGLTIPTLGTPHAGVTGGPTDVCKKANNVPAPYPNTAPTSRAISTTTSKTVINGKQIITLQTKFGEVSEKPHDGINGGVESGTYLKWAMVTKASTDVRTETQPPARHTDPTAQNAFNTTGILIDTSLPLADQFAAGKLLARCMVIELKATDDKREMKNGLLEVLQGSTVELVATRKNATAAKGSAAFDNPVCAPPPGGFTKTRFSLIRSGGDVFALGWKQEVFDGKDTLTLGTDWTGEAPKPPSTNQDLKLNPGLKSVVPTTSDGKPAAYSEPKPGESNTRRTAGINGVAAEEAYQAGRQERARVAAPPANEPPATTPAEQQRRADARAAFAEQAASDERTEVYQSTQNSLIDAKKKFEAGAKRERQIYDTAAQTIDILKKLWQLQPTTINVVAQGCSGAQTGVIKLYPHGQKEFDIFAAFKAAFQWVDKFAKAFDDLCKTITKGGAGFTFKLELFVEPTVKVQVEWKELTKPTQDNALQAHHCYIDWALLLGFEKLVAFTADFSVSLLMLAGGLGKIAEWALDKIGVRIDVGVKATISLGLIFTCGRDEYKVMKPASLTAPIVAQFSLYIVLRGSVLGSATASVALKYETAISNHRITDVNRQTKIELLFDTSTISLTWTATIQANITGLKDGKSWSGPLIDPIVSPGGWKTVWPL